MDQLKGKFGLVGIQKLNRSIWRFSIMNEGKKEDCDWVIATSNQYLFGIYTFLQIETQGLLFQCEENGCV